MNGEKAIRLDRMRYTKNTLSSGLALLAIVFDVLFFISIYVSDHSLICAEHESGIKVFFFFP